MGEGGGGGGEEVLRPTLRVMLPGLGYASYPAHQDWGGVVE